MSQDNFPQDPNSQDPYGQQPNPQTPNQQGSVPAAHQEVQGQPYQQQSAPAQPHSAQNPYGQPAPGTDPAYAANPPEVKKSKTGIIIGAVVAGVIVLALLAWGLTQLLGGSKVSDYDAFKGKMDKATENTSVNHCSDSGDSLVGGAIKDGLKQEEKFKNSEIYLCSNVDLTDFSSLSTVSEDNFQFVIGIYDQDGDFTDNEEMKKNLQDAEMDDAWAATGKNWVVAGFSNTDAKDPVLKELNGTEVK